MGLARAVPAICVVRIMFFIFLTTNSFAILVLITHQTMIVALLITGTAIYFFLIGDPCPHKPLMIREKTFVLKRKTALGLIMNFHTQLKKISRN